MRRTSVAAGFSRTFARSFSSGLIVATMATGLDIGIPGVGRVRLGIGSVRLQADQAPQAVPAADSQQPAGSVLRLTADEAVRMAVEHNLGLEAERVNPRIQEVGIAQARSQWRPTFSSSLAQNSGSNPSTSAFSGGQTRVTDSNFSVGLAIDQTLSTGGRYSVAWSNSRSTSSNVYANFDPLLNSNFRAEISQPILRNYKIDSIRQDLAFAHKDRDAADLQLQAAIVLTTRNVRGAYWDLIATLDNRESVRQSRDVALRVLADNQKRVQAGTMAPLDILEAESEVARTEESVIVAEAAIEAAQDRLRQLILDPASPDFFSVAIEPADATPFQPQTIDVAAAVAHAQSVRTDIALARNGLARSEVGLGYHKNQLLPELNAQASFTSTAAGGAQLTPITSLTAGDSIARSILAQRGFGSVLGDVLTSAYPTWSIGVTLAYPIGTSTAETNLARARLEHSQAETQLSNLELQVAMEVRDIGRRVEANQKRVASTRVAREVAERRFDAAQKKFNAGVETSFFVFQAQRDLTTARTTEVRAVADYNRSLVDFEAVQLVPLR